MLKLTVYSGANEAEATCQPWYTVTRRMDGQHFPARWFAPLPKIFRSVDHLQLEAEVALYIERSPEKGIHIMSVGEALPGPGNYWTLTVWSQQRIPDDQEDEG